MGESFKYRLHETICETYTLQDLHRMAAYYMGRPLSRIVGGGQLDVVVFELIEWSAKQPRMADLLSHLVQFKANQQSSTSKLGALRDEFEASRMVADEARRLTTMSPTEVAIFNAVETRNRLALLAILKEIVLSKYVPPDAEMVNEISVYYSEKLHRPALVITAGEWLRESGSREEALRPGYVHWDVASIAWAKELINQAGRFGAPGVAAICAVVAFDWPGAENTRRVLARLYDEYGVTSGSGGTT